MGSYARTKEDDSNAGIYCITNTENGNKYVGQAMNLKSRWIRHKSDLKHHTHFNRHLQAAWDIYGENSFKYEILEQCSVDKLDEREIYWIEYYDTLNTGYNFSEGGIGCRGYKHTEEEILKMRMIQNPKPIAQLDLQGNYLRTFVSTGEAGDFLGKKNVCGIKKCCDKNKYKKAYGYIWVYEEDYLNGTIDWDYYFSKNSNEAKPVLQYDLDMNFIKEYSSPFSTAQDGFGGASVASTCNGKYDTYKGYIWLWKDNPDIYYINKEKRKQKALTDKLAKQKAILQYDLNNIFLREWTNQEIIEAGFNLNAIQANCNGHTLTSQKYIWKYKEELVV